MVDYLLTFHSVKHNVNECRTGKYWVDYVVDYFTDLLHFTYFICCNFNY